MLSVTMATVMVVACLGAVRRYYRHAMAGSKDIAMRITVHVQPKARSRGVSLADDGSLRVRVSVPPEGGKANEAVCELLAKVLGVPKTDVAIVTGHRGRVKTVDVPLDAATIQERVAGQS